MIVYYSKNRKIIYVLNNNVVFTIWFNYGDFFQIPIERIFNLEKLSNDFVKVRPDFLKAYPQ